MSDARKTNLPKRFYENVALAEEVGGYAVRLDGRPLRTPGRLPLVVPARAAAEAIAAEWTAQTAHIDPATMPVTRLSNTIVDGIADDPSGVRDDLKRYVETDLLFYRAEGPERLVARQAEEWDPVLQWAEVTIGGLFIVSAGIVHIPQPPETLAAFRSRLDQREDAFEIAGLHQMTTLTGSIILAFAVSENHLSVEESWRLAHLDEDWNIELWGEDEEAAARREARFADMRAAALMAGR